VSPNVSAIIVNYNGSEVLGPCIDSVLSQSVPVAELIVVDNASSDGSPDSIPDRYPGVRLIRLPENSGYAAAANRGIECSSSELIALLNNDLILDRFWLENLLEEVKEPWSFWASKILFSSDPGRIDSAGDGMAVIGSGFKIGHGEPEHLYSSPREVFGACGAAALYHRDLLTRIGGFCEEFFLIYEDVDLSFRARLRGFRCLFVPSARVYHRVNLNIGRFSHVYVFYGHRNSEFVFWQNMPLPLLIRYLPEHLLFNLISLVYFTAKGRGYSFLKAKLAFLAAIPEVRRRRRAAQSGRSISNSQLAGMMERNWFRHRLKKAAE